MHPFTFIVISTTGFKTSLTGEVNVDPAFAETRPRTPELTPLEEMKKAATVTAGMEKEGCSFDPQPKGGACIPPILYSILK